MKNSAQSKPLASASVRPFFCLLSVALFPFESSAFQRSGIDCGCASTDVYQAPARGREILSHTVSFTDGTSAAENPLYTISATATQVSVTRVSDGAVLLTDTFSGDAAWGFSPDQHRFVRHSFDGSFFNVTLYDLQSPNPATPHWKYESVAGIQLKTGDTHLSFSPRGKHLLFVTLTSSNEVQLRLVDVALGQFHADSITFSTAPGLEKARYGGLTWGFSRDAGDGSFIYAYITPQNHVKWRVLNLVDRALVFDEDPISLVSSVWRFSPCGETLGTVQQTASNSMMIRLIRTFDGEDLYKGLNFPVRTVVFQSETNLHIARVDSADVYLAPNTAGADCLPEPDLQPPTWPGGAALTFTNSTYTSITVNWPAASDNVGVAAYRVSGGGNLTTLPATARSHVLSRLNAGSAYSVSVRAIDAAGNESVSLSGNASTLEIVPPAWPEGALLAARYPWGSSVDLYWRPAEHPDGVSHYRVYRNGELVDTFTANPNVTNIRRNMSGLAAGETYTFKVEARNADGYWSYGGPEVTILFDLDTPPSWPLGSELVAEETTAHSVILRWTPADHPIGFGEYQIYVDGQRRNRVHATLEADPVPTTAVVTGLCPNTVHHFRVEARDDDYRESTGGPEAQITTLPDTTAPTWPAGSLVTACEIGMTQITLYWTPAEDDTEVTAYRIYVDDFLFGTLEIPPVRCGGGATGLYGEALSQNHALTTWTVEGLEPKTSYTFRIEAGDLADNWSQGGPSVIETTYETAPSTTILPRDDYALIRVVIPGADSVTARGLNESGQVTVNGFGTGSGSGSFFWDNGEVHDTGHLGRGRSTPSAIDGSGRITGESPISASKTVGFIWDDGIIRSLGYWSISHVDSPRAINDHGDVVGSSRYVPISWNRWHRAVLWRRVETELADGSIFVSYPILNLGTLGGEAYMSPWEPIHAEAVDINNSRQVVGTAPAPVPGEETWTRRAFLWENDSMTDLGTLGGNRQAGTSSQARAINESGQVIGISINSEGHSRAFLWSNGEMRGLGTLGGNTSTPTALNENGVVVGSAATNRRDCRGMIVSRAFRWHDQTIANLGTFGGPFSWAAAVNNAGRIVGRADTFEGKSLPFLWENGTLYLIGDESWNSGHALSINAASQVLINASVITGYEDPGYGEPWGGESGLMHSASEVPVIESRVYLATPWAIAPPVWPEAAELSVTGVGATEVSLAWDEAEHRDGVSGYRVYRNGVLVVELSAEDRTFPVAGLTPETTHTFKIEAGAPNGKWTGTGPSAVATTMPGVPSAATYEEWLSTHFDEEERVDPERADPQGDPGGHGMTNLMRYALALDPRQPDPAGLPALSKTGELTLVFHYRRLRDALDVAYSVEGSMDLIQWDPLSFEANTDYLSHATFLSLTDWHKETDDMGDGTERVSLTKQDSFEESAFYRLRIELLVDPED